MPDRDYPSAPGAVRFLCWRSPPCFKEQLWCLLQMLVLATPAQARFKKPGMWTGLCKCSCMLPSGKTQDGVYDPKGGSCIVLNNKVCNEHAATFWRVITLYNHAQCQGMHSRCAFADDEV